MSHLFHDPAEADARRVATSNLGRLAPLIDEKTGIIRRIDLLRNSWVDPDIFCAVAQDASVSPLVGHSFDNRGGAAALTANRAVVRAAGECVERYCSAFYRPAQLLSASRSELEASRRAYYPTDQFYPFLPNQYQQDGFPYHPLTWDRRIGWVEARDIHSGEVALVPASCVFLPYMFHDEPITHAAISTGLAAGISFTECIEKGAAEIIERDCLMINWKTRKRVPGLDVATCLGRDRDIDRLFSSTARLPGSWYVHLLTLDVEVPVISAAFINDEGVPLTSFGISASANLLTALRGALEEALLSRFLLNRSPQIAYAADQPEITFRSLRDHLFGYAISVDLKKSFFEIFAPTSSLSFSNVSARFHENRTVVDAARQSKLNVLYYNVTPPDVAALGISSIRVLIPTAEPLDPDHQAQHLGGTRLRNANGGSLSFNPTPHPFP